MPHGSVPHESVPHGSVPHEAHEHDPPASMLLPLWVLAILSMVVGVYYTLHHGEAAAISPSWLMTLAIAVAAGGILLAWLTYQRGVIRPAALAETFSPIRRAALAGFWIDDVFVMAYGVVLLGIARVVGWFDRYVIDGVLNAVSAWTLTAGDDLRTIQTGKPQDYVYGVAVGVLAVILWMRWALA